MLREQGMLEDFIKDLLHKTCEASLVAEMYNCTCDETTRTLTIKEEVERQEEIKAFEGAPWFRDEFGILGKKDQGKKHMAPKTLYNLDGNESYKTIHDCHGVQVTPMGTPPCIQNVNKENQVIDLNSEEEVNEEVGGTKSNEKEEAIKVNDSEEDSEEEDSSSNDSTGDLGTLHPT
jgi:hypothetical protein